MQKLTRRMDVFNWDKIPGEDNTRLIQYLKREFGTYWAKIEKIDDHTIKVSAEFSSLWLIRL